MAITAIQKKRRAAALRATLTKQRIERFAKQFPVGEFVGCMHIPKGMGMVMSEPERSTSTYREWGSNERKSMSFWTIKVQWLYKFGEDANMEVETINIERIKKFKPWPHFYKQMEKKGKQNE